MTLSSPVGLAEPEALGEFLVPMITSTPDPPAMDCWAEFTVNVPQTHREYEAVAVEGQPFVP